MNDGFQTTRRVLEQIDGASGKPEGDVLRCAILAKYGLHRELNDWLEKSPDREAAQEVISDALKLALGEGYVLTEYNITKTIDARFSRCCSCWSGSGSAGASTSTSATSV